MTDEQRAKLFEIRKEHLKDLEKANDFQTLLNALPPGQVKNLLKDETCRAILNKYGITGND